MQPRTSRNAASECRLPNPLAQLSPERGAFIERVILRLLAPLMEHDPKSERGRRSRNGIGLADSVVTLFPALQVACYFGRCRRTLLPRSHVQLSLRSTAVVLRAGGAE